MAARLSDYDIVVSQPLSDVYGPLEQSCLRKLHRHVVFFSNIYFTGYHPDCVYLHKLGYSKPSPIGDYHSQIVFDGFHSGLSQSQILDSIFNMESSRIVENFNFSKAELLEREKSVDVVISDFVFEIEFAALNMFTFNHPSVEIMLKYLTRICNFLGINMPNVIGVTDPLKSGPVFPIYPAVASALGVKSNNLPSVFSLNGRSFNYEEFIRMSVDMYSEHKKSTLI